MKIIEADVLIIGSGISGLRAACAALETDANLKVAVAAIGSGPGGASFTNVNDSLGIQVPLSDEDKAGYLADAFALAQNSDFNLDLARIMADEAVDSYEFLKNLGVKFREDSNGPLRFKGCFSKEKRAFVFDDLKFFYKLFADKFISLGGKFLEGLTALSFVVDEGRTHGAVFENDFGDRVAVKSASVIAAMGGPAGLWKYNLSGSNQSAFSYGMLHRAGVEIKNAAFVQFLWCDFESGKFVPPADFFQPDTDLVYLAEKYYFKDLVGRFKGSENFYMQRNTHCPASWLQDDRVLDQALAASAEENGSTLIRPAGKDWMNIIPMAQSGNGGAMIDEHGRTDIQGLYCCGECATGMHGANRIGGGMILSSLVFGRRAGEHAAENVGNKISKDDFRELCADELFSSGHSSLDISAEIQSKATILLGESGYTLLESLKKRLDEGFAGNLDITAYLIIRHMADLEEQMKKSAASDIVSAM
ncbi:FAD-dependent oxidoreductase [Maridesulfovibrio bastinii]|uniref:FAD-dependent oxidoreductase n=1 Tax=Maridesulfovibrio bastinii TaxID=47157 RepID=UPI00040C47E4|nr:FAD-binding protein [Maridesulfovibrio bastinii]